MGLIVYPFGLEGMVLMKRGGLLHAALCAQIAALGHTQTIVIGDAGLPVPDGVELIDLAVVAGVPGFIEVLDAVLSEGVFERYMIASEIDEKNPEMKKRMEKSLAGLPVSQVPHEEFKALTKSARCVVRTGETSPYANILLAGGVNF